MPRTTKDGPIEARVRREGTKGRSSGRRLLLALLGIAISIDVDAGVTGEHGKLQRLTWWGHRHGLRVRLSLLLLLKLHVSLLDALLLLQLSLVLRLSLLHLPTVGAAAAATRTAHGRRNILGQ